MELKDGIKTFYAKSRKHWREWLEKNHQSERSVWLIIYRKQTEEPSVYYSEAVDEALCFGWIDSKPNKRDDKSYYQFFAKRNPKSNWSKINKEKADRLTMEGLMAPAGIAMVEIAKQNGCWTTLDEVENLILPVDLQIAFTKSEKAFTYWNGFSNSSRKGILDWIRSARTEATRQKRINQTVEFARENIKANQYLKK